LKNQNKQNKPEQNITS